MEANRSTNLYQYLAALVVNILPLLYGIACGWSSPNLPKLLSDETVLSTGKISIEQASWIASINSFGGFIGNVLFGYMTNSFGRKRPLLLMTIPAILAWSLILFAQNVYYLYASRLIIGLVGGGVYIVVPLYLNEIANDSIRGFLGLTMAFASNSGILIAFLTGNYCDYYTIPKVALVLSALFSTIFPFFPESPSFLFKQNRISEAEDSIRFYQHIRGKMHEYEILERKMNELKKIVESSVVHKEKKDDKLKCLDYSSKVARKAMTIGVVVAALQPCSGFIALLNYAEQIFKESGSTLSPNMSAIVIGVIQLVGGFCPTVLIDRAGRKFLYCISCIGAALGLIVLGTYMLLKTEGYAVEEYNWIPITSYSFVIFIVSCAVIPLPFVVISEILPEKIKDFGLSFCVSILWLLEFFFVKFFQNFSEVFGMHCNLYLFAVLLIAGGIFIILEVPETKGKSYEEIMKSLQ